MTAMMLALACAVAAMAQPVYVRNQPFRGLVERGPSGTVVELEAMVRALGSQKAVTFTPGGVFVGSTRLASADLTRKPATVSLAELAAALGARVVVNPASIDVYAPAPRSGASYRLVVSGPAMPPADPGVQTVANGERTPYQAYLQGSPAVLLDGGGKVVRAFSRLPSAAELASTIQDYERARREANLRPVATRPSGGLHFSGGG